MITRGTRRGTIVLAGALTQRPGRGGHTWVFLQYLLGFRRLGWEVLFIDRLDAEMSVDSSGALCPPEESVNVRYLVDVMRQFGLEESFTLLLDGGARTIGVPRADAERAVGEAPFLLNVMGYLDDPELMGAARRRVFLDIDPGFGQMWQALGLHQTFAGHDTFVTVGERIGTPGCEIPTCGLDWITTPQPVVIEEWPVADGAPDNVTGIGAWRGPNGPLAFEGRDYGLRVHEFRQFAQLPGISRQSFQYALEIHPDETSDIALLDDGGWELLDPLAVAGTPGAYREFVRGSRAEFMVAKGMYVQSHSGWFSDRSACYLASGRPVIAQDTGRCERFDAGLLTFSTLEEAAGAVESLCADYPRQRSAARDIALQFFDSDIVLGRLLSELRVA